ncbi:MAG TPA: serine protease, partial [Elusimicrobiales bacterium]|nr:serine protease [Elusimicrobiales bacterium]
MKTKQNNFGVVSLLAGLAAFLCAGLAQAKPFYGDDDLQSAPYFISDQTLSAMSKNTAALFESRDVSPAGRLRTATMRQAYNLCPDEPHAEEPVGSYCTGVIVGHRLLLTAGHCLKPGCGNIKIIINYKNGMLRDRPLQPGDIYQCESAVNTGVPGAAGDLALIKLDRAVPSALTDVSPLKPQPGMRVVSIAYPKGMPQKIQNEAKITAASDKAFMLDADSFHGSSGSPVFDEEGRVLGILVNGLGEDFTPDAAAGCNRFTRLAKDRHELLSKSVDPAYTEMASDFAGVKGVVQAGALAVWAAPGLSKYFAKNGLKKLGLQN